MNWFNRNEIKAIIEACLSQIADWTGDCENYHMAEIPEPQMIPFLNCIQSKVNERDIVVTINHGDVSPDGAYSYDTIGAFIDYVHQDQTEA